MGVAVAVGVLLGVVAALRRRTWVDYLAMSVSVAGLSTPTFVLGLLLILVLSVQWRLLPATGAASWWHYILPAADPRAAGGGGGGADGSQQPPRGAAPGLRPHRVGQGSLGARRSSPATP